ncbi:PA0069 family radical SAM protein [Rhodoblastus sp.]|jgi:DNA repair photolyase|uniref:PA0069 family radical SAM protein n=1 Tax=Rhodoblastus sp. TaxID=1962975 RepID=UPI0025E994D4|nr:PA0069 family radical SAM protein [Rhodoblastus sp.]
MALSAHNPPSGAEDGAPVAPGRRRGRAAASNVSGRFEKFQRADFDDGWGTLDDLAPFKTEVTHEKPKTVITRNDSPDIAFDRSINPYRGCEHGCVYCFARPTHAFLGLSPGLDFESRLFVKDNAAEVLKRELSAPGYQPRTLAIGTNTDPYQPIEREHRVMRFILEVLSEANHPVAIVTKSALVLRDLDLLAPMAAKGLVKVALSVTTLDRDLARAMEPRATTPARRLEAIEKLSAAGVPTAVMVAPVVPGVTDHEIETILTRAFAHGAREAGYILLRLPLETQDLFAGWLLEHFPDKYRKVLSLLRSAREGKIYDSAWGKRMTGTGPYAWMLGRRFELAGEKIGFGKTRIRLRTDLFKRPDGGARQLSLF